ncbi:hypothetical protein PB1_13719 [Bacillus methanolicus PB1]|uniref:Uncharacterized protein n=1 Tax=Bacillus methanolicus PB1 TaxID=997296 RepID=I3DWJ9_BACMT|nr:hypothetical protein [Bacillus methanolicus]EIJ78620.1 hypothetical protein PB1_13719 [Bacillus methanolicus PB1]
MNTIEKTINARFADGQKEYILCDYLGYHPLIGNILKERFTELSGGIENVSYYA